MKKKHSPATDHKENFIEKPHLQSGNGQGQPVACRPDWWKVTQVLLTLM